MMINFMLDGRVPILLTLKSSNGDGTTMKAIGEG